MLVRLLIVCMLVGLFAVGYLIGQSSKGVELTSQVELSSRISQDVGIPALQLISTDVGNVNDSVTSAAEPTLEQEQDSEAEQDAELTLASESIQSELIHQDQNVSTPFVNNRKLTNELEHQLLNVNRLRARVADLEWETLVLQSDLLASDMELVHVKSELEKEVARRPDVYNITNVPLGGVVVAEPVPDTYEPPQPQTPGNSSGFDNNAGSSRSGFYGPAPDRYEDLVNPSAAVPFNQN